MYWPWFTVKPWSLPDFRQDAFDAALDALKQTHDADLFRLTLYGA